jgi:hypothetical protein
MWFSRAWRVSAVTTALIVIACEMPWSSTRTAEAGPTPQALAEALGVEEIGRQAGLPADAVAMFARRTLFASSPRAAMQEWAALTASAADGDRR